MSKITWRIIPYVCLLYFMSFLDRVNVSFAAIHMNVDIGLSSTAFGIGAGLFFIGYFLFEIPSNLVLKKYGAKFTFARIMVLWGAISASFAFVQNEQQFYILRFLLGAAEAGFLPGILYYFTLWLPSTYRTKILGLFIMMIPLSSVIGAPLSAYIIDVTHGWQGLSGWKWMFILEGIPTILLGFSIYYVLPNLPETAKWLTTEEKKWLNDCLKKEDASKSSELPSSWLKSIFNRKTAVNLILYSCIVFSIYAVGFWIPQIVKNMTDSVSHVGYIVAIPYLSACIFMFFWSRSSHAKREQVWHIAIPLFMSSIGLFIAFKELDQSNMTVLIALCFAVIGIYSALPPYWTMTTQLFTGASAAVGLAFVNSIGNLAGYVGPFAIGYLKDLTGDFSYGLLATSLVMLCGGLATIIFGKMLRNGRASAYSPQAVASLKSR